MSTRFAAAPGRVVHFVCENRAGDIVHRPAFISSEVVKSSGYLNLHVLFEPGDRLRGPQGFSIEDIPPGTGVFGSKMSFIRTVPPGSSPDSLGTWHPPEYVAAEIGSTENPPRNSGATGQALAGQQTPQPSQAQSQTQASGPIGLASDSPPGSTAPSPGTAEPPPGSQTSSPSSSPTQASDAANSSPSGVGDVPNG